MKLDFKRKDLKAFFRAFYMTLVCIGCAAFIYLGFCSSYEAIRKTCFNDDRAAVMIDEGYFKFFDLEVFGS